MQFHIIVLQGLRPNLWQEVMIVLNQVLDVVRNIILSERYYKLAYGSFLVGFSTNQIVAITCLEPLLLWYINFDIA
jgi:hypothetical protein